LGFRRVELSIVLTGDDEVHALNRSWRAKDKPTDVLSFSQMEGEGALTAAHGVKVLGDVVISLDTAAAQAEAAGLTLEEEVGRLLVHGVLHLLGHDHVHGGPQARRMRAEERRLTALLDDAPGSERRR